MSEIETSYRGTSYMKLPHEDKVLRSNALRELISCGKIIGYTIDIGLNYYRGLPLSSIERLEILVDGNVLPVENLLVELNEKLFLVDHLPLAFTEFWGVKHNLRIRVASSDGLAPGKHHISVRLELRNPYSEIAPGEWGQIDGSAERELELQRGEAQ
ncbi:DUF6379 domain-containing protein [Klebsiella oxytoca]|uniref:C-glycoside deglycosidase beta subunit domain-containing protein n=1 Tax=Klebsiella oxytoca TaxID=571 RepID=UPI00357173F2